MIGKGVHYYSSDPFHEGGITEGIDLTEFAEKAFAAMRRNDDKAVWCFQGWGENPRREMLRGIPAEKTLVCNLLADVNANAGDDFLDRPWIYCSVNNFGGQHILRGGLKNSLLKPYNFIKSDKYTMVGIGQMPEAVENGEVFFDIIAETAVNDLKPDVDEFLSSLIKARYGMTDRSLEEAWGILAENVYINDDLVTSFESSIIARPTMTVNMVSSFANPAKDVYPEANIRAASLMLEDYEKCKGSASYIFDLADTTRQAAANYGWHLVFAMQRAVREKDEKTFTENADLFLRIVDLQEKICSCHEKMSFSHFLSFPENYDANVEQNVYLDRRLITVWGDERTHYRINDYAAREYGELIRDYYAPRWKAFIAEAKAALKEGREMKEIDFFAWGEEFARRKDKYPLNLRFDLDKSAKEMLTLLKEAEF